MKNSVDKSSRAALIGVLMGAFASASAFLPGGVLAADAEAGKSIAAGVCASCHGADGNSSIPQNPKLAGQVPGYISAQLAAFKSGARENAIMAGMVVSLSEDDMANLDAFYAVQQTSPNAVAEDKMEAAKSGARLYRGGYKKYSIAACMSCHGPNGIGIPTRYPRVAGQHPEYLEQQLLAFKSNQRKNDVMHPIAFKMSEQQIKDVSLFMSGLQ